MCPEPDVYIFRRMISTQKMKEREYFLFAVILLMVGGFLGLAVLDEAYRQPFVDLAKVCVGGFIGWMTSGYLR